MEGFKSYLQPLAISMPVQLKKGIFSQLKTLKSVTYMKFELKVG